MTFLLYWVDPAPPQAEQGEPHGDLGGALRRACELARANKTPLRIVRPNGSKIDDRQIRDHCNGKREILS